MDNLKISVKKMAGAIEIVLEAAKMSSPPNKTVDRIRLKTAAVKAILKEKGFEPGLVIHSGNGGCLDNSESCAQFSLKNTWIFEDLNTPQPKKKEIKQTATKVNNSTKTKAKNIKAKN
jgi:hypothetical protein